MESLAIFALLGLLAGAATPFSSSRQRQLTWFLGTAAIGVSGALVGGILSRRYWPLESGLFSSGNLLMSILGAMTAIMLWAAAAYASRLQNDRSLYL